jgi:hypothetical protein
MRSFSTLLLISTTATSCGGATASTDRTHADENQSQVCDLDVNGNCVDWAKVATTHGFETVPDDFYRFLELACNVEPADPPANLQQLGKAADLIAIGRITAIVVHRRENDVLVPYTVALELALDDVVRGKADSMRIQVPATCAPAGKVEGLRNSIPDSSALFILTAGADDKGTLFDFAFHYLGVVVENSNGLSFPLIGDSKEIVPPNLDGYSSLIELANGI